MAGGMQGGYGGMSPAPVQRSGGNSCLVAGLVGCGVLALLAIGLILFGTYQFKDKFGKIASDIKSSMGCSQSLVTLREALQGYQHDHNDKYPASLDALKPKYLHDDSALTCGSGETPAKLEYTPPKPDAPEDTPVISVYNGNLNLNFGQNMQTTIYTRLLKNGHIVRDQVQRTDMGENPSTGRSR
jgi:hypothetical protein